MSLIVQLRILNALLDPRYRYAAFVMLMIIICAAIAFPVSYLTNTNVLLGLCLFPMSILVRGNTRLNHFYAMLILSFGMLAAYYQVKLFYFLSLSFAVVFAVELLIGRVNAIVLFVIVIMSPAFYQATTILGFPIRLMLSTWAGTVLHAVGMNVTVAGNIIAIDGSDFSVDEACMGLSMIGVSLLAGSFLVIHYSRRENRNLSFGNLISYFIVVLVLAVASNFLRILILVLFRVLPGYVTHDLVGLAAVVFYVMVPLTFIAQAFVRRLGTMMSHGAVSIPLSRSPKVISVLLVVLLLPVAFRLNSVRSEKGMEPPSLRVTAMNVSTVDNGVAKYSNDEVLIYLKTIPEFFSGEHTPLICWRGSGFAFSNINEMRVSSFTVYEGVLKKGNEKLYTAWWYSDGKTHTVSQLEWRKKMLTEKCKFSLVNVTCESHEKLRSYVGRMLNGGISD